MTWTFLYFQLGIVRGNSPLKPLSYYIDADKVSAVPPTSPSVNTYASLPRLAAREYALNAFAYG